MNSVSNKCSFCGYVPEPGGDRPLIQAAFAKEAFICTSCIVICGEMTQDINDKIEKRNKKEVNFFDLDIKPSTVKAHLDQYIIEQEYAKTVLSVATYNHYKFLEYKKQENPLVEIEKSNVLMIGPTGTGKTVAARHLAKILDVPFAMADASSLTASGYVGSDVETVIRLLVENANGDIEKAQRGIIYLDEFDKLSRKGENVSITRDVGGESVQQGLLKIIEGSVVEITEKGQRKHPQADTQKVDTTNILFILGGSFEGIEKIIAKRQQKNKSNMGFGGVIESKECKSINECIMDIKVEDLKKFGIIPELLGRIPIICPLQELSEDALLRILTEPKNALVKQYQEMFKYDNVQFVVNDDALKEIAKQAIERKTGARALRSIMENVLLKHMYSIPEDKDHPRVVTLTKECVTDGASPIIEYILAVG